MEQNDNLDSAPTTNKKDEKLLAILDSPQEKPETQAPIDSAKTTVVLRALGLNLDVMVLVATLFICGLVGYSFARISGLSSSDIAREVSDYVWLFCYIVLGLGGAFLKLIMNKGILAEKLHQSLSAFLARTFKPKTEIDPMTYRAQNSIVGDRKRYR